MERVSDSHVRVDQKEWRKAKKGRKYAEALGPRAERGSCLPEADRQRIFAQALSSPCFEGMAEEQVRGFVEDKLRAYLEKQPWWFGHTAGADVRHQASQRQYAAIRDGAVKSPAEARRERQKAEEQEERELLRRRKDKGNAKAT